MDMSSRTRPLVVLVCLALLLIPAWPTASADEWGDARKDFRRAQRSDLWKERRDAYVRMLDFDGKKAVGEMLKAMSKEQSYAVLLTAIETLSLFMSDEATEALVQGLKSSKGFQRNCLIVAMGGRQDTAGNDLLIEIAGGKEARSAAQALLALGQKRVKSALPTFLAGLERDEWQLRAAAARAIRDLAGPIPEPPLPGQKEVPWIPADFPTAAVLEPLAASLEISEGRERGDIIQALERITKQSFGNDPAAWHKLAAGAPPESIRAVPVHPPYLCGVPVYGRKVVVVLDISTCTDDIHPYQEVVRLKELCAVPGARAVPWMKIRTTKQFMGAHVRRMVGDLTGKGTKFDIIAVYQKAEPLFGKLTAANAGTKRQASTFIEELAVQGGPNHYEGMNTALDISGSKESVAWSLGPDEIVMLTCAIPWAPRDPNAIVGQEEVGRIISLKGRMRMVPITTVGVGPHPWGMMQQISNMTGGTYVGLAE